MSDSDRQILDAFIDNIWIEKGLSQNTLDSYKSDLEQFSIKTMPFRFLNLQDKN